MNYKPLLLATAVFLVSLCAFASSDPAIDYVLEHASRKGETPAELRHRAGTIKTAAYSEAHGPNGRAAILVVWKHETHFSRVVHAGGVGRYGSDDGRAKCLGQIHASRLTPPAEWERLGGLDLAATRRCAAATLKLLRAKMRYCAKKVHWDQESVAEAFETYASGACQKPSARSLKRAADWSKLVTKLAD